MPYFYIGREPTFRMSEKIIRDPVHDVIAFRLDRGVAARRAAVPAHQLREFQRLARIRQLGWRRWRTRGRTIRVTATASA
jgi:hypothetical protein